MDYLYTKIFIITFFTSILLILFINTVYSHFFKKYHKNKRVLINLIILSLLFFLFLILNFLIYKIGISSIIFFNAAIITIIYFELAIFLEKTFWDDFLGNALPRSINLLISFVVMMNFGYFTLMFYIKVLDINYFVS